MDLHYTNNEVLPGPGPLCSFPKLRFNQSVALCAAGDSSDHSGRPGQGRGAAGPQRSHEEPEDPAGAADLVSGGQKLKSVSGIGSGAEPSRRSGVRRGPVGGDVTQAKV